MPLRALLYYLDDHTPESIESVEVPIGTPLLDRLDRRLRPIDRETLTGASVPAGAA